MTDEELAALSADQLIQLVANRCDCDVHEADPVMGQVLDLLATANRISLAAVEFIAAVDAARSPFAMLAPDKVKGLLTTTLDKLHDEVAFPEGPNGDDPPTAVVIT